MAEGGGEVTLRAQTTDSEPEYKEGNEPGASRNSMLVTTDSLEDIAQYLDGQIDEESLANLRSARHKPSDPGGGNNVNKQQMSTNDSVTDEVTSGDDDSEYNEDVTVAAINHDLSPNCDTNTVVDITNVNRKLSSLSTDEECNEQMNKEDTVFQEKGRVSPVITNAETSPELEYIHSAQWKNHWKHLFILSRAGKPIYSRHGDEQRLVTLMGVMQALVSFVQSQKDTLRFIVAGAHKFVFLLREHLILVAITRTNESHAHILLQMTYIYNQVLSILTHKQLDRIFSQLHNYDLRRLLSGTDKLFDNLLNLMNHDPSFFLGAVRCLPLEGSVRDVVAQSIAQNAKVKDLVFGILVANNQLVTLVRMKRYFLHPVDLHLIFNLVGASESFKTAESWTPICLPKFDTNGYLHAYVSYLDEACQTCLLLFTVDKDLFFTLADCKKKILEKLNKHQCLKSISDSVRRGDFSISQSGIPELRHFLYKSRSTAQFTSPSFEAPYNSQEDQERVFRLYQYLHQRLHSNSRPLKILFHVGPYETLLGWVTSGFELYAVFSPLITKPTAINSVNKLLKWIKKEEDRLFILNSPTF